LSSTAPRSRCSFQRVSWFDLQVSTKLCAWKSGKCDTSTHLAFGSRGVQARDGDEGETCVLLREGFVLLNLELVFLCFLNIQTHFFGAALLSFAFALLCSLASLPFAVYHSAFAQLVLAHIGFYSIHPSFLRLILRQPCCPLKSKSRARDIPSQLYNLSLR